MSTPTVEVTVQAANPNLPVFTITKNGSGSTIQDLIIKGSTNNAGIYINNSFYNTISENVISGNKIGVYIYNSTDNQITDSEIVNNIMNGILIDTGSDNNTIAGNTLTNNGYDGIHIDSSNNNTISNNIISDNNDGINLKNSSTQVNFNRIVKNNRYGLYNEGNGTVDATNNWWGSNNPTASPNIGSDIYIGGGNVTYDPWLVLNVNSSCDRSNRTGAAYNYIITADLTHNNHGKDTSTGNGQSQGDILPDEIPVNFSTTFGTINTPVSIRNGKATTILKSTAAVNANISVTLDKQTLKIPVNVTSINVIGIYDTRTGKGFTTIQSAINDNSTLDGDTITLADGTYTENVAVYKKLTIKPVPGSSVTVQAADPYYGVFTIVESGSTIQNLTITGAANSYGILGYADNLNIVGNTITANNNGITIFSSNNAKITGNTITNSWYGINLFSSTGTAISGNTIIDNWYGANFYNSTNTTISGNTITNNWYGIFINTANNTGISGNTLIANGFGIFLSNSTSITLSENIITYNQEGIGYYESNSTTLSGDIIKDNSIVDTSQIDITGVVMQNSIWNCGPASLATVINNIGFKVTQDELANLSGTDKSGTTMYGLAHAAQVKGFNATGAILLVDQLKTNYIVLLIIDGLYHYSVIKSINGTTVYLADSAFGNINMTLEDFTVMYSGYALIISNNSTNDTVNGILLTNEQMQDIKGVNLPVISGIGSALGATGAAMLALLATPATPVVVFIGALAAVDYVQQKYFPYNYGIDTDSTITNTGKILLSSPQGNNPTKKRQKPKPKSPGNKYIGNGAGGHVSPGKGYVGTPTTNSADLAYQKLYNNYLQKASKNWETIMGRISLNNNETWRDWNYQTQINKWTKSGELTTGGNGGPKDTAEFLLNLYKKSKEKINEGRAELKAGNYPKGMADITIGTGGLTLWGPLFTGILANNLWPKELRIKLKEPPK